MTVEELKLVVLGVGGLLLRIGKQPFQFTPGGPLHSLYRAVNLEFMARTLDHSVNEGGKFVSISWRMRPDSVQLFAADIVDIVDKISKVARQDKLTSVASDLVDFKWTIAADRAEFGELMKILPHGSKAKNISK